MTTMEKMLKAFEAMKAFQSGGIEESSTKKKEVPLTKKDHISNCHIMVDGICAPHIRNSSNGTDFPKLVGVAMETFLALCDDSESDTRMVADECLNRTIKTLLETNQGRIQVELYKEIKKNGAQRCVRAALWRFADLCHLIRPQKCRPYVLNLLPAIARVARRPEESIQETLAPAMAKMAPVLMGFTTDVEIKVILKAFLANIRSSSASMRRTAASSLTLICQYSRKPAFFFSYLLSAMLDEVLPVRSDADVSLLLGVMLTLRHMIPQLPAATDDPAVTPAAAGKGSFGQKTKELEVKVGPTQMMTVYELLLHHTSHADHNVVVAALETLHVLLKSPAPELLALLTAPGGAVKSSTIHGDSTGGLGTRVQSTASLGPSVTGDDDEQDLDSELDTSVATESTPSGAQQQQQLAGTGEMDQPSEGRQDVKDRGGGGYERPVTAAVAWSSEVELRAVDTSYSNMQIGGQAGGSPSKMSPASSTDTLSDVSSAAPSKPASSRLEPPADEDSDRRSGSFNMEDDEEEAGLPLPGELDVSEVIQPNQAGGGGGSRLRDGNIGSLTDADVPLLHCTRLLCSKFLLTGYPQGLVADRCVRVSVKALALGCVAGIVAIQPTLFLHTLHISSTETGPLQRISDVLLYMRHSDPQLKGTTALLVGNLVRAGLCRAKRRRFDAWLHAAAADAGGADNAAEPGASQSWLSELSISSLLAALMSIAEDDSSVATRLALIALKHCLGEVMASEHSELGLKALLGLIQLRSNPYWLVKVELLELVSEVDFKIVAYLEVMCSDIRRGRHNYIGPVDLQRRVVEDVVVAALGDEDARVRHAAARALTTLLPALFYPAADSVTTPRDPVIARAQQLAAAHLEPMLHEFSLPPQCGVHGLVAPYAAAGGGSAGAVEGALSRVVALVLTTLNSSTCRHLTAGCVYALAHLSKQFPVTLYPSSWCCCGPAAAPRTQGTSGSRSSVHKSSTGATTSSSNNSGGPPPSPAMAAAEDGGSGSAGPLPLVLSLLTASPTAALDISVHTSLLQLAANVFAGAAFRSLRSPDDARDVDPAAPRWPALSDRALVPLADLLLAHIARLLSVMCHIVEESVPGPPPSSKAPTLPSLPAAPSLSPIKRKAKGLKGAGPGAGEAPDTGGVGSTPGKEEKAASASSSSSGGSTPREGSKDSLEKSNSSSKFVVGAFFHLPLYMKLYDSLKSAFSHYQISQNLSSKDKFSTLLNTTLVALSQVLEVAALSDTGKMAEELLGYMKATVALEPTNTLLCVQQLLKSLFGTNLATSLQCEATGSGGSGAGGGPGGRRPGKVTRLTSGAQPGLYHCCFTAPYTQFTQCLATAVYRTAASHVTDHDADATSFLSRLRRRAERKVPAILRPGSRQDKASIAAYIRLFEPLVIKALKQYTITSSLELQRQVLSLLAQLVQLRVNYCMLDSDQIFITYVVKQFEFIENGQIRESEVVIPQIFHFLVLLSYEKYHTKQVMSMPKIIQLCDGLMASGQDPQTHAIPALAAIVHDLFVLRSTTKSDASKDLEAQREVVVSMLLRLIHHHQVLELVIIVLHQTHREGEDKWKRLSRQTTDMVLPLLARQQVVLSDQASLDVVHRLFEAVAPSVFRPVDFLLKTLFQTPADLSGVVGVERWMCLVLACLRVLISQAKEETVLTRLQELALSVQVFSSTVDRHKAARGVGDPTDLGPPTAPRHEDSPLTSPSGTASAEEVMARWLLQVVGVVATELTTTATATVTGETTPHFLCQQLAHLLLYITHMFQSGLYRRVVTTAITLMRRPQASSSHFYSIQHINAAFRELAVWQPTLTLQWCNLLILLNFDDQSFWSDILQTQSKYMLSSPSRGKPEDVLLAKTHCINLELVRRGGVVLFCDYVCENLNDAEHMTWVIINHVNDLIQLASEPPVQDFIGAIHRNAAASGLFIQAIHSRCHNFSKPSLVRSTLQCLEAVHPAASGALLTLLVDKFLAAPRGHLVTARRCDAIACRRVEMLLAADSVQDMSHQLCVSDLDHLVSVLADTPGLAARHARLQTLLVRLRAAVTTGTTAPAPDGGHPLAPPAALTDSGKINKDWFVSLARDQCFSCGADNTKARNAAHLLQHLDYTTLLNVIMSKECSLSVLAWCLTLGVQRSVAAWQLTRDAAMAAGTAPVAASPSRDRPLDHLFKAAQITLFRHINSVINMLPVPHQVLTFSAHVSTAEAEHRDKLADIFSAASWADTIVALATALLRYLVALTQLPWQPQVPEETRKDVVRFAVLGLELVHWELVSGRHGSGELPPSPALQTVLEVFSVVLQTPVLAAELGHEDSASWVCTAIGAVHQLLMSALVLPQDKLVTLAHTQDSGDDGPSFDAFHRAVRACDQISELVHCLKSHLAPLHHRCTGATPPLPAFLAAPLRNIIVGAARLPLVNSYARTPPLVWKLGWMPSPGGGLRTRLPPLPLDFLQEKDVLREFMFRVNVLGWTSRQQFEETWMCLLGVLNPGTAGQDHPAATTSPEEDIDRAQCQVLATRAITTLLLQSSLTPQAGNPSNSHYDHRPRDRPLTFLHTRIGKKLVQVRSILEQELHALSKLRSDQDPHCRHRDQTAAMFVSNLERLPRGDDEFGLGQISVESTWAMLGMTEPAPNLPESSSSDMTDTASSADSTPSGPPPVHRLLPIPPTVAMDASARERAPGIDIHSCLQFLLEHYGQVLAPGAKTPLMLVNETVRSVVMLSDVFTEKSQFEWLLDVLLELRSKMAAAGSEDELVTQYMVSGATRAAVVSGNMDAGITERLTRLLADAFKSTHLPTKMAAVYGALSLLETAATEAVATTVLPLVTDYLTKSLTSITPTTIHAEQHVLTMWAAAFYILENHRGNAATDGSSKDSPAAVMGEFHQRMLATAKATLLAPDAENVPLSLVCVLLRGLERLVLSDSLGAGAGDALVRLAVDRLSDPAPRRALPALALMLTCMYSGKQTDQWSPAVALQNPSFFPGPIAIDHDPESLIVAMERVTVLFDRIRKGCPYEARVITRVLPAFLTDFFPPHDIMNKVIGEFLSSQQPHPQLMAHVVFQVFRALIEAEPSQHAVVQDWVMLSLSNFTQRSPLSMAVWSLTVFFVAASTTAALRQTLPHVVSRMGRLERSSGSSSRGEDDVALFITAALDFRSRLVLSEHTNAFTNVFQDVAAPGNPYGELLAACSRQ